MQHIGALDVKIWTLKRNDNRGLLLTRAPPPQQLPRVLADRFGMNHYYGCDRGAKWMIFTTQNLRAL